MTSRFAVLILLLLLPGLLTPAFARSLHAPEEDLVAGELLGVQPLPGTDLALIALAADGRQLVMFTGLGEAAAILRARSGALPDRPQTHELLHDALQSSGLTVKRLVVDRLDAAGNYHAALELVDREGRSRYLDARPSDGIALALRFSAPLWVARAVLDAAAQESADGKPTIRA